MYKFYKMIINNPKKILIVFFIIFITCFISKQFVLVNYDINDYLPKYSLSSISLEIMDKEFEGGIPNARVMIKNVTVPAALEYKKKIEKIKGVREVIWLDNNVDLTIPIEMLDTNITKNYYKDNAALFTIILDENTKIEAVDAIKALIGDENAITGSAVSMAISTQSTMIEVTKISAIVVLFVFIVLIFTTSSWIEPLIILAVMGIAIVINSGSNIIFKEISFVTNAAGSILQLAVSLDYSIFLIHRFMECREETKDIKEAMIMALIKSTSSILSSGLTTVIGFLALALMQFRIGLDLGFALAKGIGISLISIFILMPTLILILYKFIEKTEHRSLLPSFEGFGKFVIKVMKPMFLIFIIIVVPSYIASNSNNFYYGSSRIFSENTKLGVDTVEVEKIFGKRDTYALIVPKGSASIEKELSNELRKIPQISGIISYVDLVGEEIPSIYVDDKVISKLESENYRRIVLSVDVDFEGEETFSLVEKIRDISEKYYSDKYYLVGEGVSTYDLMKTVRSDMAKVNFIAIGFVFIILIISMKSITLPIILVLGIETAIWLNLSVPYFKDSVIFYIAYLIINSIQLGVTVDYAILFTERYKELRLNMCKKQAIINTVSAVTISILTSGSVLTAVGFLMGSISSHELLSQLGLFIGRGTLFSMTIVFFVLPGLLYLFDNIIRKTTRNCNFKN